MDNLLAGRKLSRHFRIRGGKILKAVDQIDITLEAGKTLGLVGESGCGKSTVGRTLIGLYKPTSGEITYKGKNLSLLSKQQLREFSKEVQIIFQDPYSSINPYMTVGDIIAEGIDNFRLFCGKKRQERIYELLNLVGLQRDHITRYPHEFSGGQRQRIGIARALAVEPKVIVCDEPISALDVSIQAQIINLLAKLQRDFGLTYLFISHDLSMVRHISDKVAVMYLGQIIEQADSRELYTNPLHPYTQGLLAAIPAPNPETKFEKDVPAMIGEVPSPLNPPPGCRFSTRCPHAMQICREIKPEQRIREDGHSVSCHLYG